MQEVIRGALEVGYRCFDCAQFYGNEQIVGQTLKESGIPRSELYLISKVWTDTIYAGEKAIRDQLEKTLSQLQTDYLDLYLIHWPVPGKHVDGFRVLESLQAEKKVKSIGVSNYTVEDFLELKEAGVTTLPAVNQIEINPFLYRQKTISFFCSQGVVLQAYRALRQAQQLSHPTLLSIAEKYRRTPAQILGRWCVQHEFVFIPKSTSKSRMKENLQIFDFKLEAEDMGTLNSLTTAKSLQEFEQHYHKNRVRDTPLSAESDRQITTD